MGPKNTPSVSPDPHVGDTALARVLAEEVLHLMLVHAVADVAHVHFDHVAHLGWFLFFVLDTNLLPHCRPLLLTNHPAV